MAYNLFSENGFNFGSAAKHYSSLGQNVSPFTPVPSVIDREERCSLFYFWRHHLWLKLTSSSAEGKNLFNDTQIRMINGAWIMQENA